MLPFVAFIGRIHQILMHLWQSGRATLPDHFSGYQGCQIFLGTEYQKREKIYQITTNYTKCPYDITNTVKWTKCPGNILTSSIAKPSKKYSNLDFWFENKPSGNPGGYL
jgi:uncharacterized protein YdaL